MSKLLFIYERDMPTISITRDVFTNLKEHEEIKSDFKYLTDVTPSDIDEHDMIILLRPNDIYSWKVADMARKAGHVAVVFCDDDLLHLPKSAATIPWRKRGLRKALAHSDVIWSSSRYIANKYRKLTKGKRKALTDTILRPEELEGIDEIQKTGDKIKIVYAAAPSHAELFEKYIGPVIPKLYKEFGDKISFTFVSVHPEVSDYECEYIPGMPLMEYRKFMKENGFDIGLAPLEENRFTKCKYFNKFIEYTTQGTVGIYSKTEPFTYVVKDRINGFLAENTPEAWYSALKEAITDTALRKKCVENAVEYLRTNHTEDACIKKICKGLPELCECNRQYKKCESFGFYKILYYLSRPFDWIYLLFFYLKTTGIKAVLKRTKTHFTEAKAYRRKKN